MKENFTKLLFRKRVVRKAVARIWSRYPAYYSDKALSQIGARRRIRKFDKNTANWNKWEVSKIEKSKCMKMFTFYALYYNYII